MEREVARHRLDPQGSSRSCVPPGCFAVSLGLSLFRVSLWERGGISLPLSGPHEFCVSCWALWTTWWRLSRVTQLLLLSSSSEELEERHPKANGPCFHMSWSGA